MLKVAAASAKTAVAATKAFIAALSAGGWVAALILIVILIFGAVFHMTGGDNLSTVNPVSAQVETYRPVIQKYADQHGIGEYSIACGVQVLKAELTEAEAESPIDM